MDLPNRKYPCLFADQSAIYFWINLAGLGRVADARVRGTARSKNLQYAGVRDKLSDVNIQKVSATSPSGSVRDSNGALQTTRIFLDREDVATRTRITIPTYISNEEALQAWQMVLLMCHRLINICYTSSFDRIQSM